MLDYSQARTFSRLRTLSKLTFITEHEARIDRKARSACQMFEALGALQGLNGNRRREVFQFVEKQNIGVMSAPIGFGRSGISNLSGNRAA
jgi:hypothetical protein